MDPLDIPPFLRRGMKKRKRNIMQKSKPLWIMPTPESVARLTRQAAKQEAATKRAAKADLKRFKRQSVKSDAAATIERKVK